MSSGNADRDAFRPEIQALRAVAVTGVVLFHLWPWAVPGGFVGVDVFFVISGYLITDLLVRELLERDRVSLTRFWVRRIRRILPAAFLVLAACVTLVVFGMPRVTWATNLTDIRAAATYVENWQLGARAVNYLASSTSPTIVQHYWSLSVEEQFYICWPLLIVLAGWLGRRTHGSKPQLWIAALLALAGVASFITSIVWTSADPAMAFFALPTRAWEFAFGGLLGFAVPWLNRTPEHVRAAVSWTGLAVVGISMFAINGSDPFPGAIAALPVAGAALVVATAVDGTTVWSPARLYRGRTVQWLGDNSYGIYLWHWPLIIAGPWVIGGALGWAARLVILVGSLVLARVGKWLVEDPVRRGAFWRERRWPAYGFAAIGVVALTAVTTDVADNLARVQHAEASAVSRQTFAALARPHERSCFGAAAMVPVNRCARPFARPKHLDTAFAAQDGPGDPCLQPVDASTATFCTFGHTRHPRKIVAIIGNSHAWRLAPALALYAHEHDWEILEAARINCLGLIVRPTGPDGATPSCLSWSADVRQRLLALPRLNAVIFAGYRYWQEFTTGNYPTPAETDATRQQILAMWRSYDERGVRVLVTQDVPGMRPTLDPTCLAQSSAAYDPCAVPRSRVVQPTLTTTLARALPRLATYLPLDQYFCDRARCHALIGGVVVYFDDHHLTTTFSRSLAPYLGAEVAAAIA